jgi:hypothetical protein
MPSSLFSHDVLTAFRCRVRAALRAAARRTCGPFVRTALRAAALRCEGERRRAAERAWRESDLRDAARRPSRFSALRVARERRGDGLACRRPARLADAALRLVVSFALAGGGGRLTPDRRAFESPIAIACFVDRAPCLPSRM